jgi:hypothetical protein
MIECPGRSSKLAPSGVSKARQLFSTVSAQFLVMATCCLSVPLEPRLEGLDDFRGQRHHAGRWPREGVDFLRPARRHQWLRL